MLGGLNVAQVEMLVLKLHFFLHGLFFADFTRLPRTKRATNSSLAALYFLVFYRPGSPKSFPGFVGHGPDAVSHAWTAWLAPHGQQSAFAQWDHDFCRWETAIVAGHASAAIGNSRQQLADLPVFLDGTAMNFFSHFGLFIVSAIRAVRVRRRSIDREGLPRNGRTLYCQ